MSIFIKNNELYSKHFPVVGVTPTFYGFNNLSNMINPYINPVNRIQMYDGFSGKLLPSFTPESLMTEMINNFKLNPNYTAVGRQYIKTSLYNTTNFSIGLIGCDKDIDITRKALDLYMKTT